MERYDYIDYSTLNNKEIMPFVTTWMVLEDIKLREMSRANSVILFYEDLEQTNSSRK
jgi:hypothetical protein